MAEALATRDDGLVHCGQCKVAIARAEDGVLNFYPDLFKQRKLPKLKKLPDVADCPLCDAPNCFDPDALRLPANQDEARAEQLRRPGKSKS